MKQIESKINSMKQLKKIKASLKIVNFERRTLKRKEENLTVDQNKSQKYEQILTKENNYGSLTRVLRRDSIIRNLEKHWRVVKKNQCFDEERIRNLEGKLEEKVR